MSERVLDPVKGKIVPKKTFKGLANRSASQVSSQLCVCTTHAQYDCTNDQPQKSNPFFIEILWEDYLQCFRIIFKTAFSAPAISKSKEISVHFFSFKTSFQIIIKFHLQGQFETNKWWLQPFVWFIPFSTKNNQIIWFFIAERYPKAEIHEVEVLLIMSLPNPKLKVRNGSKACDRLETWTDCRRGNIAERCYHC